MSIIFANTVGLLLY